MKLNKKIFQEKADKLRKKAVEIKFDDYYTAKKVCEEGRSFIAEHKNNVNAYVIEGIEKAEIYFSEMSESKNINEKAKFWTKGIEELIYVFQVIRNENSYSD